MNEERNESVAYEKKDVQVRAILWTGVAIIVSAILIHTAVWWLFRLFDRQEEHKGRPPATLVNARREPPPEPRLQPDPPTDLNRMRAMEDSELHTYGWVDRPKGVIRIPIEQAITLLVQRGLPKNQQPSSNANVNQNVETEASRNSNGAKRQAGKGQIR